MRRALLILPFALLLGGCDEATKPESPLAPDPTLLGDATGGEAEFRLTILHNNDGESSLLPDGDEGGVARFAGLVHALRREALLPDPALRPGPRSRGLGGEAGDFPRKRGVLMVSSGDNFLAGPEFNASLERGIPFFDAVAMDLIGYDAAAIGNHEFDFGPEVFADFVASFGARYSGSDPVAAFLASHGSGPADGNDLRAPRLTELPFLSANLDVSAEPELAALESRGRIARSVVVRRRGEAIGIVGATTPNLPFISSPRNVEVFADVASRVQAEVDALSRREVEIVLLASHLQGLDEEIALVSMLDGVDAVIAGGGDELLANENDPLLPSDAGDGADGPYPRIASDRDGTPVPVVATSGQYRYVGRLILEFDNGGELVRVNDESGPVRVFGPDGIRPDPRVRREVEEPVEAAVEELANNILGTSAVALDGRRSEVRSRETNQGNLIADALLQQANALAPSFGVPAADVALQNGGGIRNDEIVPSGPISELKTFEMLPFTNFVAIVPDIPRTQFKLLLENAVSRAAPGDPGSGTGRFAQIAGFTFEWNPSGTAQKLDPDGMVVTPGTRVLDVRLSDGTAIVTDGVVQPGPALNVATIDFLANGGDQYPFRGAPFTRLGVTYQQALENYIVEALGGVVSGAQYPEGGEGRIVRLGG